MLKIFVLVTYPYIKEIILNKSAKNIFNQFYLPEIRKTVLKLLNNFKLTYSHLYFEKVK